MASSGFFKKIPPYKETGKRQPQSEHTLAADVLSVFSYEKSKILLESGTDTVPQEMQTWHAAKKEEQPSNTEA